MKGRLVAVWLKSFLWFSSTLYPKGFFFFNCRGHSSVELQDRARERGLSSVEWFEMSEFKIWFSSTLYPKGLFFLIFFITDCFDISDLYVTQWYRVACENGVHSPFLDLSVQRGARMRRFFNLSCLISLASCCSWL